MSELSTPITPGSGTNIDGFRAAGGFFRQAIVLADPNTSANVVAVSAAGELAVNPGTGTFTIRTDPGYELGSIKGINSSISVYLSGTAGTIRVGDIPGILNVGLMPIGSKLNLYSARLTTNATTTVTNATAYITSLAIVTDAAGTGSTVTIQDKSGTPLKLIDGLITTVLTTTPVNDSYQTPLLMTGGIDIVTAGAVAAAINVWINYYQ